MPTPNPIRRPHYNDYGITGTAYPVHYAPELGSASVLAPSKYHVQLEFEKEMRKRNWGCVYCQRENPGTEYECLGCGAGRLINKMSDEELIAAARRFFNG